MASGLISGKDDLVTDTAPQAVVSAIDGAVRLPEGTDLGAADYARLGPDLVITAPDGATFIVSEYFLIEPPADLMAGDSARLGGETAVRLAGPLAPGQVAQASATDAAQPIGKVELVDGTVTATRSDGSIVELAVGDPVFQGDIIESADASGIGIVLADDTTFAMAESGRMVLDEMIYDPGAQEGSLAVSVLEGVFTFVSGQVAKTDASAMTIETPLATIGIRGTQAGIDMRDGKLVVVVMQESAAANSFVGDTLVIGRDAGDTVTFSDAGNWTNIDAAFALDRDGDAANESYTAFEHESGSARVYVENIA